MSEPSRSKPTISDAAPPAAELPENIRAKLRADADGNVRPAKPQPDAAAVQSQRRDMLKHMLARIQVGGATTTGKVVSMLRERADGLTAARPQ